jgi:glycerol transport system ATP-binding protein
MLELERVLGRRASHLSADAKQKISLGRGLVRSDVAAILFDEPLTVIDPALKWRLRRDLKEVHARYRRTLVYVTHDQNEALTFAEQVVVMHEGRIVQVGTPRELFEEPAHRFVGFFIGSPGMNFLPCRGDADGLAIEGTDIVLGGEFAAKAEGAQGPFAIGIRPEFVEVADEPLEGAAEVKVRDARDLGNFRLLTLGFGPHTLYAKREEDAPVPAPGATAWMSFPPGRAKLYARDLLVA